MGLRIEEIVGPWKEGSIDYRRAGAIISAVFASFLLVSCINPASQQSENEEPNDAAGDDASPNSSAPGGQGAEEVIASTTTSTTDVGKDFRIDIHALERNQKDSVILDFSMVNLSSSESIVPYTTPEGSEDPGDTQTLALIDGINKKKYLPLIYVDDSCYCKDWDAAELSPGERVRAWIAFPEPPKGVSGMTLTSAAAPPILDIPVRDNRNSDNRDPTNETKPPEVWDLHSTQDNLSDGSTRNEGPNEVSIALSSDVLFATDKSNIDETAEDKIEQVAQEITDSGTDQVRIDGHTDNTGSDAVNEPLSEERAQSVQEFLGDHVNNNIEFDVAGHGSSDPVATNETPEGKSKNRRVTITFSRQG